MLFHFGVSFPSFALTGIRIYIFSQSFNNNQTEKMFFRISLISVLCLVFLLRFGFADILHYQPQHVHLSLGGKIFKIFK
jgi:hypothetical protein